MCQYLPVSLTSLRLRVERTTSVRRLPLLVALVLTALVRVVFLLRDNTLSADEAVTGIMARKMASGSNLYIYFAGQNYNSAVEQYPQAALFALGAPQTAFVLRLPELVINIASCWLIYWVAQRMFSDSWRPGLAALLFALGPIFQITRGSTTTGSYTAQLALGLLTLWCALALSPQLSRRRQLIAAGLVGLALTGTFSLTASGYFLVLPAIAWAVPALVRLRLWPALAVGAVLGALPPLVYALRNHASVFPHIGTRPSTVFRRLQDLLDPVGRMFLGLSHSFGTPGLPVGLARLLLWIAILTLLITAWAHRRSVRALVLLRPAGRNPLDIAVLALMLAAAGYVASKYAYFTIDPRYLYPTTPALILLLAAVASPSALRHIRLTKSSSMFARSRWRPTKIGGIHRVGVTIASVALLLLVGLPTGIMLLHPALDSNGNATALPSTGLDGNMEQAVSQMRLDHTTYLYSTYWLATPMEFLANGRLTAVTYGSIDRFPADRAHADAASVGQTAWLDLSSSTAMPIALRHHHIGFRKRRFGQITIYDRFTANIRPQQLGLHGP